MKTYQAFTLVRCPNPQCGSVHVYLFDKAEDERPSAATAIVIENIPEIIKSLQTAAYEHAVEQDHQ